MSAGDDVLEGFDVVHDSVAIGPHRLRIARPRSAEDLIDEAEYARDERLPYWAELWPSAHVLARTLAGADLAGRTVVELGCGVGLPSVVAALGGARATATDWYAPALAFARANATAAGVALEVVPLDWLAPDDAAVPWGTADLVIGADVLYEERYGPALAALIPRLLAPGAEALIADPRRPHADGLLDRLRESGWDVTTTEERHGGRIDESGAVIRMHRLRPPRG